MHAADAPNTRPQKRVAPPVSRTRTLSSLVSVGPATLRDFSYIAPDIPEVAVRVVVSDTWSVTTAQDRVVHGSRRS